MKRRAIIVIIPEATMVSFLAGVGRVDGLIPVDAKITGYHHNLEKSQLELRVEHPQFNEIKPGESPDVYTLAAPEEPSRLSLV